MPDIPYHGSGKGDTAVEAQIGFACKTIVKDDEQDYKKYKIYHRFEEPVRNKVIEEIDIQQVGFFVDVVISIFIFFHNASKYWREVWQKSSLDLLVYPEKHHKPYQH